ncbi:hypothetical protein BCR34DRAFT_225632 [Clohesyomyces aquaticus]|uniref:Polymerase nucleotidyl transferase domain-containing protein n=1 Tax=Clohesyomyces aquaticus TaxID=1231657 RepID=A0A1Y1Y8M0_9PLEO|nr:hypothetical protein BCR34DRAFT_225632 [Clohesyomyces aquaticus]
MYDHHLQSIENTKKHFEADPSVLALLLTGSIAHGYESADSDVDVVVILSDENYASMASAGRRLTFTNFDLCTYPGGFVDGKYISMDFIRRVGDHGSEPARFAFEGAKILFSRTDGLEDFLKEAVSYPISQKTNRIVKFRAQLDAWYWYCSEARKKNNAYLLNTAASKLVLFGTRLILAHNEILYPFHKWMLKELERAPEKPGQMMEFIAELNKDPSAENVERFYEMVRTFRDWEESPNGWGSQFMLDTELNWMSGSTPVDDI